MKHIWPKHELTEHFTLFIEELALLIKKPAPSRIGFAVMLKFFQHEGRFPRSRKEIPKQIVRHLAEQLDVPSEAYYKYNWQGRSIRTHRTQIRQHLGFKKWSRRYMDDLIAWLQINCLPEHFRYEQLEVAAASRLHDLKIEAPRTSTLERIVNWELIRRQYDQMIKYATAIRLGTAETESILRRFTRENLKHPTYQALLELGRALRTVFLCEYLHSETLRREINEELNVIELWNDVNDFILFGKGGEIATNRRESQELAMLCLHLLQNCLVYINTLMVQQILNDPVNPYGIFRLDMDSRLPIESDFREVA